MNSGEKLLTRAVFLDVAKAFDTVWVDDPAYKLIVLNFPSYLLTITSHLCDRTFETLFQTATYFNRGMRADVAQGEFIFPVLFSLYVNDISTPFRHVEVALNADDTTIITTYRKPVLLVTYLESYLSDL